MASLVRRPDSPIYYIQHSVNGRSQRISTGTKVLQIAKEKLRQFESAQARGDASPFPTFIFAGLRREELVWLTREDLDLAHGQYGLLRIRAKTIDGQFWQPKTRTNRAVPVSRILRRYLDVYLKRNHHPLWLFPSSK